MTEAVLVLDVGKTHAKLTLVSRSGEALAVRTRANAAVEADGRPALDAEGVEAWLKATAPELARLADIAAVAPVGHGAAAALIVDDKLAAPVLDYEAEPPAAVAAAYDGERDAFEATLSPRLPQGLNLGLQLYWQEKLYPELWPKRAAALLWPQYWAWRLCGTRGAEVTSLGCHSDLWRPYARAYSGLARRRGWSDRLGPLRHAGERLAAARREFGLGARAQVLCGLHDSNASLNAVRACDEVAGRPFSLVSTGTWFVTFQSGGAGPQRLDPACDTLANVDVEGRPVPSARFMGGRQYAEMLGDDLGAAPTFADAERAAGRATGAPDSPAERAASASLRLALTTTARLELVGAEGPIVVEGRFADDAIFTAALAALRPSSPVYAVPAGGDGVAIGAARLYWPGLRPPAALRHVERAPFDLSQYAAAHAAREPAPVS